MHRRGACLEAMLGTHELLVRTGLRLHRRRNVNGERAGKDFGQCPAKRENRHEECEQPELQTLHEIGPSLHDRPVQGRT